MIYAINYDLKKKGQDYDGLYKAIKALGDWAHYLDSLWLVDTNIGSDAIVDQLKRHFDGNDRLLVMKLTTDRQGLLSKDEWGWVNKHE